MERDLTGRCGTCGFFVRIHTDDEGRGQGECRLGCWPPPLADTATCPHHKPIGASWDKALARKRAAGTPRRYRDDGPAAPTRPPLPKEIDLDMDLDEFRNVLREVLREELSLSEPVLGDRWRGGEMILKPGKDGTQDKHIPLDTFFNKIVMLRDRLRVLEQKVNGHKGLSPDDKLQLQHYITACYGSLTTFNVLFKDRDDQFVGQSAKD